MLQFCVLLLLLLLLSAYSTSVWKRLTAVLMQLAALPAILKPLTFAICDNKLKKTCSINAILVISVVNNYET